MLVLPEVLTLREATTTLSMLEQAMRADDAATLTIDASALRSFDTAAVAVLLECRRLARTWNKGFEVRSAPAKLSDLVRMYGVESLLAFAAPPGPARCARRGPSAALLLLVPDAAVARDHRAGRGWPPGAGGIGARRVRVARPGVQHRLDPAPRLFLFVAAHEQVEPAGEGIEQEPFVGTDAFGRERLVEVEVEEDR